MPLPDVSTYLTDQPLLAIPISFAAGVLNSLSPCIYPMLPITAAVVVGTGSNGRTSHGWRRLLPIVGYVGGLTGVYATLGLMAGLTGSLFGAVASHPGTMLVQANVLIAFALMSAEVIPVPVSTRWMAWAAARGGGGSIAGASMMGAVSGLVAAPCGAPVFGALLTWVATTRNGGLGFMYLAAFALGMSSLLVAIGVGTERLVRLPRAGHWMLRIKQGFAALMVLVAEWYLVQAGKQLL